MLRNSTFKHGGCGRPGTEKKGANSPRSPLPLISFQRQVVVIQQHQVPAGSGSFAYQHMQEDAAPPPYANPGLKTIPGAI